MNRLKLSAAIVSTTAVLAHSGTALATIWSSQNLGGSAALVQADTHAGFIDLFAMEGDSPRSISFRTGTPGMLGSVAWSAWQNIGNPPPGSGILCSADSVFSNHAEIWTIGFDGNAWTHALVNNVPAGGWQTIGAPPVGIGGCVRTVSWGAGRLDMFVRGGDNQLWHNWYDNGQGSWGPMGGQLGSDPYVVSSAPNQLDVFVLTLDSVLWDVKWNGPDLPQGWKWHNLGITTGWAPPMGAKSGTGSTLGVAFSAGGLKGREYAGGSWGPITSAPGSAPSSNYFSVYRSGTRVDTFFLDSSNGTIKNLKYDHGWGNASFSTAGSGFGLVTPVAVSTSDAAHVFVTKPDGNVWYLKGLGL